MNYKFEYINNEEKSRIIKENSHLILIEEQNLVEGNFLIFSEHPIITQPTIEEIAEANLLETQYRTLLIEMLAGF